MNGEIEYTKEYRKDGTVIWTMTSDRGRRVLHCLFRNGYEDVFYRQYSLALYRCALSISDNEIRKNLMYSYKERLVENGIVFPAPFILIGVAYSTPNINFLWGELKSEKIKKVCRWNFCISEHWKQLGLYYLLLTLGVLIAVIIIINLFK